MPIEQSLPLLSSLIIPKSFLTRRADLSGFWSFTLSPAKAGFSRVFGIGTHITGAEADVGAGTFLRYTLWANLQLQIRVFREMIATGMYKLRGWV